MWCSAEEGQLSMAYDRYEIEFHLTPTGWVTGTEFCQGTPERVVTVPADRVETWLLKAEQSSGWSREDREWQLTWVHPTLSEAERVSLRRSFDAPSRGFPS